LWSIDVYAGISKMITDTFDVVPGDTYVEFPYDWRRDNRVHASRLARLSSDWLKAYREDPQGNPKAKLVLVGHSMGGLISRYFLECLDGWRETRALVTFGTPYRGAVKAIGALSNGMHKGIGPIGIDLSAFIRSLNSAYQLLPIYPCVDGGDGKLLRTSETDAIPHVERARAQAALDFHHEISDAVERHLDDDEYVRDRYEIRPVIGTFQSTAQSVVLGGDGVKLLTTRDGKDEDGDGTVPRISATPIEVKREANAMFAAQQHASLQDDSGVLVQLDGLLTGLELDTSAIRGLADMSLSLDIEDAYSTLEPVHVRVRPQARVLDPIEAVVEDADGREVARVQPSLGGDEWYGAEVPPLPAGTYRVTAAGEKMKPVTDVFAVFPDDG